MTPAAAPSSATSNQILILEKLKSAIDRGLRQTGQLFAESDVNRFSRRMSEVLGERSINCETLRGDSNASRAAELLEIETPMIDLTA